MSQLYRHFDAQGRLLYIGISLSAVTRLMGHRAGSQWFRKIARVEIQTFPSRAIALQMEREAIQKEHPRYNIEHTYRKLKGRRLPTESQVDRVLARLKQRQHWYAPQ